MYLFFCIIYRFFTNIICHPTQIFGGGNEDFYRFFPALIIDSIHFKPSKAKFNGSTVFNGKAFLTTHLPWRAVPGKYTKVTREENCEITRCSPLCRAN